MARAKRSIDWKLQPWTEVRFDGSIFMFNEIVIKALQFIVGDAHKLAKLIPALLAACREYLWERDYNSTRPKTSAVLKAIKEAVLYAEEHKTLISGLDERTTKTIATHVQAINFDQYRKVIKGGPSVCLDHFVSESKIRQEVLRRAVKSYQKRSIKKGGRPIDSSRRDFAHKIAIALRNQAIPVSAYDPHKYDESRVGGTNSGIYYKILDTLFIAMTDKIEDLRPLMRYALQRLKKISPKSKVTLK